MYLPAAVDSLLRRLAVGSKPII